MALINCPECKKQISDMAKVCPSCGYSFEAQVIEATGKDTKAMQLIGFFLAVAGVVIFVAGSSTKSEGTIGLGVIISIIGFALLTIGKVSAWWHHG
jgi:uncharacterized membrane protein